MDPLSFPWLVRGITDRAFGNLSLFTAAPVLDTHLGWERLLTETSCPTAVHARQVHGTTLRLHDALPPGLLVAPEADGHATVQPGVLLTVTVADCVPVYIVHGGGRAVALLHAGWRGVAAGVLENALATLAARVDLAPATFQVHLGPAICGACYEVGPEVHRALGRAAPTGPAPVDLRAELARRAIGCGVPEAAVTVSEHCTRCDNDRFFSHRAGDAERQVAYLALAPGARAP